MKGSKASRSTRRVGNLAACELLANLDLYVEFLELVRDT
jgi:hypothetical protein